MFVPNLVLALGSDTHSGELVVQTKSHSPQSPPLKLPPNSNGCQAVFYAHFLNATLSSAVILKIIIQVCTVVVNNHLVDG